MTLIDSLLAHRETLRDHHPKEVAAALIGALVVEIDDLRAAGTSEAEIAETFHVFYRAVFPGTSS